MEADLRTLAVAAFSFCMLLLSLAAWPVFIAGIQILTAELAAGRSLKLFSLLQNALKIWPRIAMLCIFVYGVYFLLTAFAFGIAALIIVGASSLLLIFVALGLLVLQVWMFGRFFINVLFWQQFAVLAGADAGNALRQSKELARSRRDLPWFQRPMWRGVFIASIWFALTFAINVGSEWHSVQHYFQQLTTSQDPQALIQALTTASKSQAFNLASFTLGLVQTLLRPLLGIAFVLLYFDSKSASRTDSSYGEIDIEP
jgi:hypothetical protein